MSRGAKMATVIVDCALYENGRRRAGTFDLDDLPRCENSKTSFVWIGLYEPTDEEFAVVREQYRLHPLAVEDAIQAHQRPKLDVYEGSVFVVVKTAEYLADEEVIKLGEIQVFIGDGFIVHVRHGAASPLTDVRRKLEASPRRLVDGPSAVLHAIVDHVVDCYVPVVTRACPRRRAGRGSRLQRRRAEPRRADLHAQARGARTQRRARTPDPAARAARPR